jgi:hypothetical protein
MTFPGRLFASISICALFLSPLYSYGQDLRQSNDLKYFLFNNQSTPSKELLALLERQVRWDDAGSGNLNPTESRFNASGLRLRFEKINEQAPPGGRVVARYRVFAEGAPENKVYSVGFWSIAHNMAYDPRDIYVNEQGLLMLHQPKPEQETSLNTGDDEYDIQPVTDNAEPMRYLFYTRYGPLMIPGTLVPHPVVSEDHGCRMEVRIAQPHATAVLIIIDRFPAKAKIPLVLESEEMIANEILTTDAGGHAVIAVFPYLRGKTQGVFKANAEGPKCLPNVILPWGAGPPATPKTR